MVCSSLQGSLELGIGGREGSEKGVKGVNGKFGILIQYPASFFFSQFTFSLLKSEKSKILPGLVSPLTCCCP